MPYENGRGCPKCRFAPNGCPSGCHVKPYNTWKGESLTPERKIILREEAMERLRQTKKRVFEPVKSPPDAEPTTIFDNTWIHKYSEIRIISKKLREDGSHVLNVCVAPLIDDKIPRTRQLCNSAVNSKRFAGQYGLPGYAQVASCSCIHCYSSYMGRQWSNDLRTKINGAIRQNKEYDKYQALIGLSRDELIAFLMEKLRVRYGLNGITWEDVTSGRHKFEIDEIIPRQILYIEDKVNDVDEWTRIFNHKNLQLLTKEDNVKKGAHIDSVLNFSVFSSIFSMEAARRIVIDSRLKWIKRRLNRGLTLLDSEHEFLEIHDRSTFF